MCLLKIFSSSLWLIFFILLTLSFPKQKFLVLMKPAYQLFLSWIVSLVLCLEKFIVYPKTSRFFPILSPRSFTVLCLIFRSMIYFQLIFEKSFTSLSSCRLFLMWTSSFSRTIFKRTIFTHCTAFDPLKRSVDYVYMVYFWAVYSVPLIFLSVLQISHCFDYCGFIVSLEVR